MTDSDQSGIALIRGVYGVPARRGGRVRLGAGFADAGREGVITTSENGGMRLRIRLDGERHSRIFHPTWELEYLDA